MTSELTDDQLETLHDLLHAVCYDAELREAACWNDVQERPKRDVGDLKDILEEIEEARGGDTLLVPTGKMEALIVDLERWEEDKRADNKRWTGAKKYFHQRKGWADAYRNVRTEIKDRFLGGGQ